MNNYSSNVCDFLLDGKPPGGVSLRLLHKDYTYGDLQAASGAVARFISQRGGEKGDRVVLISENSFFWVAAYLGIMQAGRVCVPLPSAISGDDLQYIVQITDARLAFAQRMFAVRNSACFRERTVVTDSATELADVQEAWSFEKIQSMDANPNLLPEVNPRDLAALMFTSGSTGRPRGVMVSHANIMANTESIVQYLSLTKNDRIMTVLPFHYCFGTSLLHSHLRVGGSLVIESRFMYPESVLQRMQDTECTGFAGVPSHFQILLRNSSLKKKNLPHLRYVQQAGGHLAPNFVRELIEALPKTQVFIMYGQTEATARLSYLPPDALTSKLGSIGKGIPGVKLRVMKSAFEDVSPGEVGEIAAEGENVALGYWRDPEESAVSFRDGKLYTGDLATVDEDGFIYVVDRAKDILKCGGKRVSCQHVEDQLLEFDSLLEAAVIGVPDGVLGEAVKAFVVPRKADSNGLEERLRLFCKERMPLQLVPKEIVVLAALPKNSSGKVLKQKLKMA